MLILGDPMQDELLKEVSPSVCMGATHAVEQYQNIFLQCGGTIFAYYLNKDVYKYLVFHYYRIYFCFQS